MAWRLARALETLRSQVNKQYPNRSKNSDGSIGDENHSARTSDHNPDDSGVVRAIDITHDPKGGFDSYAFADMLLRRQDPRLKYVISNRRIGSGPAGPSAGVWRKYAGANPHDHHCHISVVADARGDDARLWDIDGVARPKPEAVAAHVEPPATLRKGDAGPEVMAMQTRLNIHGARLLVDGDFGPVTADALQEFQKGSDLVADAICGPMSWAALNKTISRA
jgi:hypothetical protein